MQDLTEESKKAARLWFANNLLKMAEEAEESIKTGVFYCNDPSLNALRWRGQAQDFLEGRHKMTFTFWQRAYAIQTGECIALLPK